MAHIFNDDFLIISIDESLEIKILGEIFSNYSSQEIYKVLTKEEITANDLAIKINLRLNLVMHHLKKMETIHLVGSHKKFKSKHGPYLKYYHAKSLVLVGTNVEKFEQVFKDNIQSFKNEENT